MNISKKTSNLIAVIMLVLLIVLLQVTCSRENNERAGKKELKVWAIPNIPRGAEFYFSPDAKLMVGNAKFDDDNAFHTYIISPDGKHITRINDKGEDACSYFFPDGKHIVFTSTKDNLEMPAGNWSDPNDYPQGAELYTCDLKGKNEKRITDNRYYDAEVSVSPDGNWILFTRQIDGRLDLWKMHPDGSGEFQITHTRDRQEGGSFFINNETIIFRAWKIEDQTGRGKPMTIFTIKSDGSGLKQITQGNGTNWAPHPAPDGDHFVFAKLLPPHNFEIFLMSMKTGEQTRLTYNDAFDGFPVLSPDGKLLTFSSSRDAAEGERKLMQYLMDVSSFNLERKN